MSEDRVNNKIKELQANIAKVDAEAKQMLAKSHEMKGNAKQAYKQKCLMALKKKKQYENQLKQYYNHQMTLDNVKMTSEQIKDQKQMMQTMQHAVKEQKKNMESFDIDKMEDLRDQMMDLKMDSEYMNHMMNQNYDLDYDSDQFQDEFLEFQKEVKRQNNNKQINVNPQQQQANKYPDINSYLK